MTTARCNKTIVLLMDNAKYHHASEITEWIDGLDGKIVLLFLPPYSPELNPIERVWKLVRRTATYNRYFGALDELSGSIEDLFESWSVGHMILARLCA